MVLDEADRMFDMGFEPQVSVRCQSLLMLFAIYRFSSMLFMVVKPTPVLLLGDAYCGQCSAGSSDGHVFSHLP